MMADDLRSDMKEGFARVDEQLVRIDGRFARVDERFAQVDERFDRVDAEFAAVRAEIRQSAEDSRRYFLMLTERILDSVKQVADGHAHNSSRLDNHEKRLKTLEKARRT